MPPLAKKKNSLTSVSFTLPEDVISGDFCYDVFDDSTPDSRAVFGKTLQEAGPGRPRLPGLQEKKCKACILP